MLTRCPKCERKRHVASAPESVDGLYRWVDRCSDCKTIVAINDALDPQPKPKEPKPKHGWFDGT